MDFAPLSSMQNNIYCHTEDYFSWEREDIWVKIFRWVFTKDWGKKESLTTLKSWIIPSIFWDFTWGVLRRCVLHYWLTVCVYGTLLSLDLCMFSPQTNRVGNWQMQGVKYWLCVRVCVRAKCSCASVSACVCACFWLPSWFHLSVLPRRHKPLPSASCSKFLCVPNKRQEVEFKSKFFITTPVSN